MNKWENEKFNGLNEWMNEWMNASSRLSEQLLYPKIKMAQKVRQQCNLVFHAQSYKLWTRLSKKSTQCCLPTLQCPPQHSMFCCLCPEHCFPPYFGFGSLHSRVLCLVPLPQTDKQFDQDDHEPQCPSTRHRTDENEYIESMRRYLSSWFSIFDNVWGRSTARLALYQ